MSTFCCWVFLSIEVNSVVYGLSENALVKNVRGDVAGVFDEAQLGAWPDFRQSSYPIPGHVSVVLCGHNYDQLWVDRDIVVFHVSKLVHYPTHELESLGVLQGLKVWSLTYIFRLCVEALGPGRKSLIFPDGM